MLMVTYLSFIMVLTFSAVLTVKKKIEEDQEETRTLNASVTAQLIQEHEELITKFREMKRQGVWP